MMKKNLILVILAFLGLVVSLSAQTSVPAPPVFENPMEAGSGAVAPIPLPETAEGYSSKVEVPQETEAQVDADAALFLFQHVGYLNVFYLVITAIVSFFVGAFIHYLWIMPRLKNQDGEFSLPTASSEKNNTSESSDTFVGDDLPPLDEDILSSLPSIEETEDTAEKLEDLSIEDSILDEDLDAIGLDDDLSIHDTSIIPQNGDVKDRLLNLKKLLEDGVITQEEHDSKRQQILSEV